MLYQTQSISRYLARTGSPSRCNTIFMYNIIKTYQTNWHFDVKTLFPWNKKKIIQYVTFLIFKMGSSLPFFFIRTCKNKSNSHRFSQNILPKKVNFIASRRLMCEISPINLLLKMQPSDQKTLTFNILGTVLIYIIWTGCPIFLAWSSYLSYGI